MAGRHRIMCVGKGTGTLPHEVVTHVGGRTSGGKRWKISLSEAVGGIREGVWTFYVVINREPLEIQVARDRSGVHYLRTEIDGDGPVSLLQLPDCGEFSGATDEQDDQGGERRSGSEAGRRDDVTWP